MIVFIGGETSAHSAIVSVFIFLNSTFSFHTFHPKKVENKLFNMIFELAQGRKFSGEQ